MKKLLLVGILLLTVCAGVGIAGAPCGIIARPPGWSMIANPCNSGAAPLSAFLPVVPDGTTIYKFNGIVYDTDFYTSGLWDYGTMTLGPGEGAFILLPVAAALGFGGVPLVSPQAIALPVGFSICSPPAGLGLAGFPADDGDAIYMYDPVANVYDVYTYIGGAWDPATPVPAVGESFWVFKLAAALWVQ